MRRITTVKNYGKYNEAILVCNDRYQNFCDDLSEKFREVYGIKTEAINYTQITQPTKDLLRKLRTAYRVIFMLSNGVVEESLQTEDHPFLKMYAYVHQHNPLAIACVTLDDYVVTDGLPYPEFMRDFDYMHRKGFRTWQVKSVAEDLAKEIRRYYPRERKVDLSIKHTGDYWAHRRYFEKYADPGWINYLGMLSGGLAMIIWALMLTSKMDYSSCFVFYDIFCSVLLFVCYVRRFCMGITRKNAGLEHMYTALGFKRFDELSHGEIPRKARTMRARMATNKREETLKLLFAFGGWLVYTSLELGLTNSYVKEWVILALFFLKWIYVAWLFTGFVRVYLECLWGKNRLPQKESSKALDVYDSLHDMYVRLFGIRAALMLVSGVLGVVLLSVAMRVKALDL